MRVYNAKIRKDALLGVPENERSFFLSLAHFANEINALQKLVLWSWDFSSQNPAVVKGQMALSFMLLKLLAGKLKEGNELLRMTFYGSSASRDYEPLLSKEAQEALSEIKRYFGRDNLIHQVRKKYAFHYSPDEVAAVLPLVSEDLDLYIDSAGRILNNLYDFAEVLANTAMLSGIDHDTQAAFSKFRKEVISVAEWFTIVSDGLIVQFLKNHFLWDGAASEISLGDFKPTSSVRLPWFTDPSDLGDAAA